MDTIVWVCDHVALHSMDSQLQTEKGRIRSDFHCFDSEVSETVLVKYRMNTYELEV